MNQIANVQHRYSQALAGDVEGEGVVRLVHTGGLLARRGEQEGGGC